MSKTPLEALQELVRLKRRKDMGLHYPDEQKQSAWDNAFDIVENNEKKLSARFMEMRNKVRKMEVLK